MIFGIGTDITKISRFASSAEKLAEKYFTKDEMAEITARGENIVSAAAKRFAAKEACGKAIGTGFRDGLYLRHIEILHEKNGKPYINLYEKADEYMKNNAGEYHIHVSISDDGEYAQAFVVIEKI